MTDEEYIARRSHLRSINPQLADCPPADELAALEERFIDEKTAWYIDGMYDDPFFIQEQFMEADPDNTTLVVFFRKICEMMKDPDGFSRYSVTHATASFLEENFKQKATADVEAL